jgi:hypothetical protein
VAKPVWTPVAGGRAVSVTGARDFDSFDVGPGGDPRNPEPRDPEPDASERSVANRTRESGPDTGHEIEPDERTVEALGTLSEAVEWIERARGRLYDFHQLTGHADELLSHAADQLDAAGHAMWAAEIRAELVGRNVIDGRWTFQVVDEYDDTYWGPVRSFRSRIEAVLAGGRRHRHEAALKERRRSHGRRHHEAAPPER